MTHARALLQHGTKVFSILLALALVFSWMTARADAHHEPANKFVAAGSGIQEVDDAEPILTETMRVSSPFDLAISATAECTILTYLRNAGGAGVRDNTAETEGTVDMWVTIDGIRVPVQSTGFESAVEGEQHPEWEGADNGEVTFCNRAYTRRIIDMEEDENSSGGGDGIDEERDFIRTRTANSFNWFALDVGEQYDSLENGNNIIEIQLWASFDKDRPEGQEACVESVTAEQEDCSDAFVGKRTLLAEPTNASIHEVVAPQDPGGS